MTQPNPQQLQESEARVNPNHNISLAEKLRLIEFIQAKWTLTFLVFSSFIPKGWMTDYWSLKIVMFFVLICTFKECIHVLKVSLGTGRVTGKAVTLRDAEQVVLSKTALLERDGTHSPGRLTLTTERLIFELHEDSRAEENIGISLKSIESIKPDSTRLFGFIPLCQCSVLVKTQEGMTTRFALHGRDPWLAALAA